MVLGNDSVCVVCTRQSVDMEWVWVHEVCYVYGENVICEFDRVCMVVLLLVQRALLGCIELPLLGLVQMRAHQVLPMMSQATRSLHLAPCTSLHYNLPICIYLTKNAGMNSTKFVS